MSLENLLKIGQLKEHPVQADEIERLLSAAQRNLRDARIEEISPETRFDAAYKAIMQSTPLTLGLSQKRMVVLDALRRQRNVADYTGEDVDVSTAQNCIAEAKRLRDDVIGWRKSNRPELVPNKSRPA